MLAQEWWLVLNNNEDMELVVMKVPAKVLNIRNGDSDGLVVRMDKPDMIDLNINTKNFIDRKSGVNFSPFVLSKIKY